MMEYTLFMCSDIIVEINCNAIHKLKKLQNVVAIELKKKKGAVI